MIPSYTHNTIRFQLITLGSYSSLSLLIVLPKFFHSTISLPVFTLDLLLSLLMHDVINFVLLTFTFNSIVSNVAISLIFIFEAQREAYVSNLKLIMRTHRTAVSVLENR